MKKQITLSIVFLVLAISIAVMGMTYDNKMKFEDDDNKDALFSQENAGTNNNLDTSWTSLKEKEIGVALRIPNESKSMPTISSARLGEITEGNSVFSSAAKMKMGEELSCDALQAILNDQTTYASRLPEVFQNPVRCTVFINDAEDILVPVIGITSQESADPKMESAMLLIRKADIVLIEEPLDVSAYLPTSEAAMDTSNPKLAQAFDRLREMVQTVELL